MAYIHPVIAAKFANEIYAFSRLPTLEAATMRLRNQFGSITELEQNSVVKGRTGGPGIFNSRTAFGMVLLGKGQYDGHAFIVYRGTQYLADWLTNFNVGTSRSLYGQSVHDGFNRAFRSTQQDVSPFIAELGKHKVHSVHCIGHSLGGALATLAAEFVRSASSLKPYIYTFGMPRVGCQPFADMLCANIGPERIHRVYHRTDIVPCIPLWPFVHIPTRLADQYNYFIPTPGNMPGAHWHSMRLYEESVSQDTWENLRATGGSRRNDESVKSWLEFDKPIAFTVTDIEWLNRALVYVVNSCVKVVGNLISGFATSAFTLMDRIAYILARGIDLAEHLSSLVLLLIRKIMNLLGMRRVIETADLTREFIRRIFMQLSQRLNAYCRRVLDDVLVDGRAV